MTSNQTLTQEKEIKEFKERILKNFGINIHIITEAAEDFKISIQALHVCTLKALKENEPDYHRHYGEIQSLAHKSRLRPFLVYVQAMSYIAYREGYSKTAVGKSINRDHATIINSVKQVENAFFTKDKMMMKAFNNIIKEIHNYVGNLPENLKEQINSKPGISSVWNEGKNNSNSWSRN